MKFWNRVDSFVKRNLTWSTWVNRYRRLYLFEFWFAPLLAKLKGKQLVYILHINKTAGTSLFHALADLQSSSALLVPLPHKFGVADLPKGSDIAFFIRAPETRFASGFEHCLKRGYPHYRSVWSEEEKKVFEVFPSFSTLMLATNSELHSERVMAEFAWRNVFHLRYPYAHFFGTIEAVNSYLHRVVFVGEQETLESDWKSFCLQFFDEAVPLKKLNVLREQRPIDPTYRKGIESIYPTEFELYELMKARKLELLRNRS